MSHHVDWSNSWIQGSIFEVVSAALGWGVTILYARDAAKDTKRQLALTQQQLHLAQQQPLDSQRQSRMLATLHVTMEEDGRVKLVRDAKGEIAGGRVIELQGTARGKSSATGDLTAGPRP